MITVLESAWYLLRTKSGDESTAQCHLERQGYRAYCPWLVRRRRLRGRRVRTVDPLFPQYLFVELVLGVQDLGPVHSTRGVLAIVRFGLEYAIVPAYVITQLHERADPRTGMHHLEERRLTPHSTVRITGGTFFGLEGVFLRDCGSDRVLVLLSVLGQATPVAIGEGLVEPQISARVAIA